MCCFLGFLGSFMNEGGILCCSFCISIKMVTGEGIVMLKAICCARKEKCHTWREMPCVKRNSVHELLCMRHLVTSAQLWDLGLLGVAYLIVASPKLVMGHDRYKAIDGIFCPILEPEWWWIHNRRTASILYYLVYFIKDFTGAQNSPAIMAGSELNIPYGEQRPNRWAESYF